MGMIRPKVRFEKWVYGASIFFVAITAAEERVRDYAQNAATASASSAATGNDVAERVCVGEMERVIFRMIDPVDGLDVEMTRNPGCVDKRGSGIVVWRMLTRLLVVGRIS